MSRRAAQKELINIHKQREHRGGLNAYTLMDVHGRKVELWSEACFSAIRGAKLGAKGYDYLISASRSSLRMPFEECHHFLKWLLNDSPVAKMFFTKSPKVAWKKGVVVDCHQKNQAIGFGLTMHRTIFENPGYVRTFNFLYEAGINPAVCAVIMSCTATDVHGRCMFTRYGISHGPFGEVGESAINMFKKGEPMFGNDESLYKRGTYENYCYLFHGGRTIYDTLVDRTESSVQKGAFVSFEYYSIESVIQVARKLEEEYCG